MLATNVERFEKWFSQQDPAFDQWLKRDPKNHSYVDEVLKPFEIEELIAAAEHYLTGRTHTKNKSKVVHIGRIATEQRANRGGGACRKCLNQRYFTVLTPETVRRVAEGQLTHLITCQLSCECTDGRLSFQKGLRDGHCVIHFERLMQEAVDREQEETQRRVNGNGWAPPQGFTTFDVVLCQIAWEWVLSHSLWRRYRDEADLIGEARRATSHEHLVPKVEYWAAHYEQLLPSQEQEQGTEVADD